MKDVIYTLVNVNIKIEKQRDSNYAAESMEKMEDKKHDLERDYERSKKEIVKRKEILEEEKNELRDLWEKYRESVDDII